MKAIGTLAVIAAIAVGGYFGFQYYQESQQRQAEAIAHEVVNLGVDMATDALSTAGEIIDDTVGETVRHVTDVVKGGPREIKEEVTEAASEAVETILNWWNQ